MEISAGEYVAGEKYDLDEETALRFLMLDYASCDNIDDYVDIGVEEWEARAAELKAANQTVNV
jgi:hypothetical protein